MRLAAVLVLASLAAGCGAERGASGDVAPSEALALAEQGALFLDVRTPEEYATGHVPGAVNVPYDELSSRIGEIDARRGDPVVVYCEKGPRASKATAALADAGFSSVRSLAGHMSAYRASGLPVER
jgi:phage shock protein E